ncbi:MAG: hypothetical protein IIY21_00710 [Clostridiales bacterium]|nr:hypothetical protein [Clostridiales bacterium]
MDIYEKVREVPQTAQKTIQGGRLKGFTDINPMWRIKALTEQFGPCGVGWYLEIKQQWLESSANGEVTANVIIELYIKTEGEWSKPIVGIGGSKFVSNEKNGPTVSDECFKMALTDAISVACKSLGFGADIYWSQGRTKYDTDDQKKNAYPSRLQMLDVIRQHYPDGEVMNNLCKTFKINRIEDATDEQLIAVYNKYKS